MSIESMGLFQAIGAKMDYLDQRQKVIAQNVANADTPGYQPHDLSAVDFSAVLKNVTSDSLRPMTTDPAHMPSVGAIADPKNREQRMTYEVAPDGNAVIMEEQMLKSNQIMMDYNLMTMLYQKQLGLIRMAVGRV